MILILGTPGAGKTTQASLLAKALDCPWFSMGGLIRDYAHGQARQQMLIGKIIDDDTTLDILSRALARFDLNQQECVLEGNPRSIPQAKWWLDKVNRGQIKLTAIIHLTANTKVILDRLKTRGRLDDLDESVINERFKEYKRSIKPVLDYLKKHAMPVYHIDSARSIDQVQAEIRNLPGIKDEI